MPGTKPFWQWTLTHVGEPVTSTTQATSMTALSAAATRPLGKHREQLIGVEVFHPSSHQGKKTVVKGVLIEDAGGIRLNVTSLQTAADTCANP